MRRWIGLNEKSNIFGFDGTDSSGGVPETREIVHSCRGSQRLVFGVGLEQRIRRYANAKVYIFVQFSIREQRENREQCLNK